VPGGFSGFGRVDESGSTWSTDWCIRKRAFSNENYTGSTYGIASVSILEGFQEVVSALLGVMG
jgi:hypothetical protein